MNKRYTFDEKGYLVLKRDYAQDLIDEVAEDMARIKAEAKETLKKLEEQLNE